MATNTTINRPAPYLEAAGETLLDLTTKLTGKEVDTSKFAPTVAGQNVLTQQAQQQAATQAGLGTLTFGSEGQVSGVGAGTGVAGYQPFLDQAAAYSGPQGYQGFMSPYQQDIIDTSLAEFDKQKAIQQNQIAQNAITAGAFGGARQGVQEAEFGAQTLQDRALLQAQMLGQGYAQANQLANQGFEQQKGLASLQPSLAQANIQALGGAGTSDLGYQQALLDASAQGNQLKAYEPYNRLQFLSSITGGLLSGQPQAYMTTSPATGGTAGPLSTALGTAASVYGLGSLFGK
jgi:hypothetical protein|tara:strand:+ start:4506 stop:5375 length:870 start_codon:yes stop_codon:yes gene_type:complete